MRSFCTTAFVAFSLLLLLLASSSTTSLLSDVQLSRVTGATMMNGNILDRQDCSSSAPKGEAGCVLKWIIIPFEAPQGYCEGGCEPYCMGDGVYKYCKPQCDSNCDTANEMKCGGSLYMSTHWCLYFGSLIGCRDCDYAYASGGC